MPEVLHHYRVFYHARGGVFTVLGTLDGNVFFVSHEDKKLCYRPIGEFMDNYLPIDAEPLMPGDMGQFERVWNHIY